VLSQNLLLIKASIKITDLTFYHLTHFIVFIMMQGEGSVVKKRQILLLKLFILLFMSH